MPLLIRTTKLRFKHTKKKKNATSEKEKNSQFLPQDDVSYNRVKVNANNESLFHIIGNNRKIPIRRAATIYELTMEQS